MKQAEFFLIPFVLRNDDPPVNPFDCNFPDTAFDILKDLIHVDTGIDGGLGITFRSSVLQTVMIFSGVSSSSGSRARTAAKRRFDERVLQVRGIDAFGYAPCHTWK